MTSEENRYGIRIFDSVRQIGTLWYPSYAALLRSAETYLRNGRRVEYTSDGLLSHVVDGEVTDD